jgi:MATE family multidrug resistance protein
LSPDDGPGTLDGMHGRQAGSWGAELAETVRLAWPVVGAELGWMFMGVVDTLMVGRLAPEAIGAVGLGGIVFFTVAVFGMGVLLGLDTFVSQAFGAGNLDECHRWLRAGVHLSFLLAPPVMLATYGLLQALPLLGLHPQVRALTIPYVAVLIWSTLPLLLYASFRRYLQALGVVRPVMLTLIGANIVNAAFNWLLIFGRAGFPALGVAGSAWSTVIARVAMAAVLLGVIVRHERKHQLGLGNISFLEIEWDRIGRLVRLGTPAALQITAEVGVFGAVAALAGRIDPVALAAHQVALNIASVTFMVPLGLASAGAVRVGHAVGRRDALGAERAGWSAIALGAAFMTASAVVAIGVTLLRVAAAFQLFDGVQGVTTGALRGLGDTRTAMIANLVGHWLIGLPFAAFVAFQLGFGVVGLWVGLSVGLTLVAIVLVWVWRQHLHRLADALALAPGADAPARAR